MLVGIDFDNTIVCYDGIFHKLAVERGLIPEDWPASKGEVRDYLRQQGLENRWIELQGYVYGALMLDATPFPGALEFLVWCKDQGISVCIISHRTRHPFIGLRYDLHQVARKWVKYYGFYERTGLSPEHVHFELTKQEKLNRIEQERCNLFIDDLPEFLAEPGFPAGVRRILFDPNNRYPAEHRFERAASWEDIKQFIMKRDKPV
jgi:5'(3')-deoxyribonucleotidase